jgi:diguanylate cyclase (GGDEF)-like protein
LDTKSPSLEQSLFRFLQNRSRTTLILCSILIIAILGVLDYFTGYDLSIGLFYLVPVATGAFVSRNAGLGMAVLSALTWFIANGLNESVRGVSLIILAWNAVTRLGFFASVGVLLSALLRAYEREQTLARTDHNTRLANSRAFLEAASVEVDRAQRYHHSLCIAYIDIDDFKWINDRFGHQAGDEVLRTVASTLKANLRSSDLVGRLGGDEFGILFPETNYDAADVISRKLMDNLKVVVARSNWPISFSMGIACCTDPHCDVNAILSRADALMYAVKLSGKNGIKLESMDGSLLDHSNGE